LDLATLVALIENFSGYNGHVRYALACRLYESTTSRINAKLKHIGHTAHPNAEVAELADAHV
jgi:hypothetical protein